MRNEVIAYVVGAVAAAFAAGALAFALLTAAGCKDKDPNDIRVDPQQLACAEGCVVDRLVEGRSIENCPECIKLDGTDGYRSCFEKLCARRMLDECAVSQCGGPLREIK